MSPVLFHRLRLNFIGVKVPALLLTILSIGFCVSCNEKKTESPRPDYIIFSGTLTNPNSNALTVSDLSYNEVLSIQVEENGAFNDTLKLATGYYNLNDGKERTPVFFQSGLSLHLTLTTDSFDESIRYEGDGAPENNYLAQKALLQESFGMKNYYGYYAKLSEDSFLNLADSLQQVKQAFLKKQSEDLNPDFVQMETEAMRYDYLRKLGNYESMRRFVTKVPDFRVSNTYPALYTTIDFSDERKLNIPGHSGIADAYVRSVANKKDDTDTADYYLTYMRVMDHLIESEKLKESLAYSLSKSGLESTEYPKALYQRLKKVIKDPVMVAKIDEKRSNMRQIAPGMMSPNFEFENMEGQRISLRSLRGQLVYIDVWATWCLPCIHEIPHLQELEKSMHGKEITFVSICKNDEKSKWEHMVTEKDLGGIQLFAHEEDDQSFFDTYMVNGIPRFILIDASGKIVDADAKRPSNPELSEQLNALLAE